jgi:hypothetical protein
MDIYFKWFPKGGSGFVLLKAPNAHPEVFCPEVQNNCLPAIVDHNNLKSKRERHFIRLPMNWASRTAMLVSINLKVYWSLVVLHNCRDGAFPTLWRECTKIKPDNWPDTAKDLHIGNILGDYFWVTNHDVFKSLSAEDFDQVASANENRVLVTYNPIKFFEWRMKTRLREYLDEDYEARKETLLCIQ